MPEDNAQPMYVRLPVDLHAAVKDRAAQDDRTMAQTIRVALRYFLNNTQPTAALTDQQEER